MTVLKPATVCQVEAKIYEPIDGEHSVLVFLMSLQILTLMTSTRRNVVVLFVAGQQTAHIEEFKSFAGSICSSIGS